MSSVYECMNGSVLLQDYILDCCLNYEEALYKQLLDVYQNFQHLFVE